MGFISIPKVISGFSKDWKAGRFLQNGRNPRSFQIYLITSLKKVERGTEGGISIEGTLASVLGSMFMAFIMLRLSIISTKYHFIVVLVSGFLATLSESIIGAKFQNKYKLSNELVNAIQTSIASVFAIFVLFFNSYFLN